MGTVGQEIGHTLHPKGTGTRQDCKRSCVYSNRTPLSTIARARKSAMSDNPVYLAGRERIYQGLRKAGLPEQ
jgi:hypothetical protein